MNLAAIGSRIAGGLTSGRESRSRSKARAAAPVPGGSEIAGIAGDIHEPLAAFMGLRINRDPLLSNQQPGSDYAWPYGLFEEAVDKDAHLFAILGQRKAALLSWELAIEPADSSAAAQTAAELVREALAGIGGGSGFTHDLYELLDALAFGFAVGEVLWERRQLAAASAASGTALLLPATILSRHPRRFVFDSAGELRLLTNAEPFSGEALPPRRFIVFAPYGRHENPYGMPLLRSIWWLAWFKRQVLKLWVMFCEKHGSPTAVLRYPAGATERDKRAYRRIVGSIQQETGLVLPEGVELSLLEAQRTGSVSAYSDLIELCNREMSKALLGQTLTTEPGERGARSLGEVHQSVREDIVRQDAQALAAALERQLVRWIIDLNLPAEARSYPRVVFSAPQKPDYASELAIDRFLAEQGLAQDAAELYQRYGRKKGEGKRFKVQGKKG